MQIIKDTTILVNGELAEVTITIPSPAEDVHVTNHSDAHVRVPSKTTADKAYRVQLVRGKASRCDCQAGRCGRVCWHSRYAEMVWDLRQEQARKLQTRIWTIKHACGMTKRAFLREWNLAVRQCCGDKLAAAQLLDARFGTQQHPHHGFRRSA